MMTTYHRLPAAVAALLLLGLTGAVYAGQNTWTTSGPNAAVNRVVTHPLNAATLFACAEDGLYKRVDDDQAWQAVGQPLLGKNVIGLAIEPVVGELLYAGLNTGLYISADSGGEWTLADTIGPGIMAVATGPPGSQLVYAGTFGRGIYVSADAGSTWTRSSDIADAIVFSLETAPKLDTNTAYAGTAAGLNVTRDGGATWNALGASLTGLSVRAVHQSSTPEILIVATFGQGVLRSTDAGQSWTAINSGLTDLSVRDLAVVPDSADQIMLVATSTGGFFRTKDGGDSWLAVNPGLPDLKARSVLIHPDDSDRVLGSGPAEGVYDIRFSPEPQISLAMTLLDFGSTPVGTPAEITIEVINSDGVELVVTSIAGRDDSRLRTWSSRPTAPVRSASALRRRRETRRPTSW